MHGRNWKQLLPSTYYAAISLKLFDSIYLTHLVKGGFFIWLTLATRGIFSPSLDNQILITYPYSISQRGGSHDFNNELFVHVGSSLHSKIDPLSR